jgi:restriction system protein
MARKTGFNALMAMPWAFGAVSGIAGFSAIRYGVPWWFASQHGVLGDALIAQSGSLLAPLPWLVLGGCWHERSARADPRARL